MKTRRELETELEEAGLPAAAVSLVADATAPSRHKIRVQAALDAAVCTCPLGPMWVEADGAPEASTWAGACFALIAETAGTGGRLGAGLATPATERLPGFQNLGTGRRHAGDGMAWDAAIAAASQQALAECQRLDGAAANYAIPRLEAYSDPEQFGAPSLRLRVGVTVSHDVSPAWESLDREEAECLLSLARRGVLATAPGVPDEVRHEARRVRTREWGASHHVASMEGDALQWGAFLQAVQDRLERPE